MRLAETRAVARLARRTARRQWRRTALIVAIIALPVAASQIVAGIIAAGRVTPEEYTTHELGSADLRVASYATTAEVEAWLDAEIARIAPHADIHRYRSVFTFVDGIDGGLRNVEVTDLDIHDPLAAGKYGLVEGRAPVAAGEVAISDGVVTLTGAGLGDAVVIGTAVDGEPRDLQVVGIVRDVLYRSRTVAVVSPADLDTFAPLPIWSAGVETYRLIGGTGLDEAHFALYDAWERVRRAFLPEPAVWPPPAGLEELHDELYRALTEEQILTLAEYARDHDTWAVEEAAWAMLGQGVVSPSLWAASRQDYAWGGGFDDTLREPAVLGTAIAALLMAEVALVAGAAYATGTRRRLRELGLMSVNGATAQHLRWSVVGEGAVAGLLGAGIGTVIAAVAMSSGRPVMQNFVERLITGFPLGVAAMAGPALVGAAAAIAAAWIPARTAARVPATTALQGRMPLTSPPRWVVPTGLALAGFGAFLVAVARTAYGYSGAAQAALGVVVVIAGFALLAGPIVAFIGARADRFRATTRLVLRDSARQRTRAATAIAATMVVLAAPVVLGAAIGTEQQRMQLWGLEGDPAHVFIAAAATASDDEGGASDVDAVLPLVLPYAERVTVSLYAERGKLLSSGEQALGSPQWSSGDEARSLGIATLTPELLAAYGAEADGEVIVLGVRHRKVEVVVGGQNMTAREVPAGVVQWSDQPRLLVSTSVAHDLGLTPDGDAALWVNPEPLTERQRIEISNLVPGATMKWPPGLSAGQVLLIGGVAALLVVLLIVGLVTGLSATESDHDLRTMVAVGAPPRIRRSFLGIQTVYYTLFAALLAAPLALLLMKVASGTGFADSGPFGTMAPGYIAVPWMMVGAVVIVMPLIVGGITALTVRSAPTMPPHRVG